MSKKQIVFSIYIILFLLIMNLPLVFAETIVLKSGKQIEGKIIEKTDQYLKIEIEGIPVTYWLDEIERVDEKASFPSQVAISESISSKSEIEKIITPKVEDYLKNKKYKDTIPLLRKAIELAPDNPEFYLGLGICYYYVGDFQEASSLLQKAIELQPEPDFYICLGVIYDSMGFKEEAKAAFNRSIEISMQTINITGNLIAEALLKKISEK